MYTSMKASATKVKKARLVLGKNLSAIAVSLLLVLAPFTIMQKAKAAQKVVVGPTSQLEPGVLWHEVDLPGGDGSRKLWIYLPSKPAAHKTPCVFIAPAGSTCVTGMALGQGDAPEHTPYAEAGLMVVAYSLDGNVPAGANNAQYVSAAAAFRSAHCGLDNERAAVAYALHTYPQIDAHRLIVAGHSSAGTMALLAAEHDPRIAACVAYAPDGDVAGGLGQTGIDQFSAVIPDFQRLLNMASPLTNVNRLHCPVFIFHADDDDTVRTSNVLTFLHKLKKTNHKVTYTTVPRGGHYDSMRVYGIKDGINWIKRGLQ